VAAVSAALSRNAGDTPASTEEFLKLVFSSSAHLGQHGTQRAQSAVGAVLVT